MGATLPSFCRGERRRSVETHPSASARRKSLSSRACRDKLAPSLVSRAGPFPLRSTTMDRDPDRWRLALLPFVLAGLAAAPESATTAPGPAAAWEQAHVRGKYRTLLRQFKDPDARGE